MPVWNIQAMSSANGVALQSFAHFLAAVWTLTVFPLMPSTAYAHWLSSRCSRKNPYGSTMLRSVYVPFGSPVMSTHWYARNHPYLSPHPMLMPILLLSAFGSLLQPEPR